MIFQQEKRQSRPKWYKRFVQRQHDMAIGPTCLIYRVFREDDLNVLAVVLEFMLSVNSITTHGTGVDHLSRCDRFYGMRCTRCGILLQRNSCSELTCVPAVWGPETGFSNFTFSMRRNHCSEENDVVMIRHMIAPKCSTTFRCFAVKRNEHSPCNLNTRRHVFNREREQTLPSNGHVCSQLVTFTITTQIW